MASDRYQFSVFTKPWPDMPLAQLGEFVAGLGFQGIELPARPGFQIPPERARELPAAAKALGEQGVKILSVAGPADAPTIAACAEAGVPVIRVMARIGDGENYLDGEARLRREYDALVPLLDRHGVTLGVQNHCGRFVANALGLRRLIGDYDPRNIAAVWDAAHEAVAGTEPELALDAIWSHLCMVNLKNAFWQRTTGPEACVAQWQPYWTAGRLGLADWPRVAAELKRRDYQGVICLTAEYSAHDAVKRLIAGDMAFAQSLFA